jgi:hypothetical protein
MNTYQTAAEEQYGNRNVLKIGTIVGWKSKVPSGEATESFVIFLYGATNVFLEHLSNAGKAWSATDLEHVSIWRGARGKHLSRHIGK